jgi:hypothetical protein
VSRREPADYNGSRREAVRDQQNFVKLRGWVLVIAAALLLLAYLWSRRGG